MVADRGTAGDHYNIGTRQRALGQAAQRWQFVFAAKLRLDCRAVLPGQGGDAGSSQAGAGGSGQAGSAGDGGQGGNCAP